MLTVALLLQSIPIAVTTQAVSEEPKTHEKAIYALYEDSTLRDETTKHFRMSDGSYTAVSYPSAVHFLNKDGSFYEIDNTLKETVDGYKNTQNPFLVLLPKESDDEVVVENEGKKISFKLIDSKKSKTVLKENKNKTNNQIMKEIKSAKTEKEKAEITNNDKYTLKNHSSGIVYKEIFDDIDVTYDICGTNLKESIVLNKKNEKNSFIYAFTYSQLKAVLNEDNSVTFSDGKKEYFTLASPYMFDSNNVYSTDISVKLTATDTGCIYELIPDKNWLNDKSRKYPVTIDPTVSPKLTATDVKDATAIFANYSSSLENWAKYFPYDLAYNYLAVGKYNSKEVGYCIYTAIPDGIPDTARIINASVVLSSAYSENSIGINDVHIKAYMITSDWNTGNINEESILFTTPKTNGYAIPNTDSLAIDYTFIYRGIGEYYDFDITKAAQYWHNGGNNYGIMFRMDTYSLEEDHLMAFCSSDYNINYATRRPLFYFNYRDTSGLEDYWSYHSASAGNAGTGYVNDFGGNLTFIHTDASYMDERYNVSLAHVYNSNNTNVDSPYGNGWQLNLAKLGKDTISGTVYEYYMDSDGTKHYLSDYDGVTKDEDDLGYIYTTVSGDYPKQITTKNHETMLFDSQGRLRRITDRNNNTVNFSYNTYGLTEILTGTNRIITLSYDGNKLSAVNNEKTGHSTTYSYDSSGNLVLINRNFRNDVNEIYTYTYNGKLLESATDCTGYRITYNYGSVGSLKRVTTVSESTLDSNNQRINGQVMIFNYKNGNQTVIEDCGVDGNISTTDDNNKMTYQFDILGQPVCIYDEDGKGATYKYSNSESAPHQLTLSSASYGYIAGGDIVKEGNFGYEGAFWETTGNSTYMDGDFWLDENSSIYQNLSFSKGKYKIIATFDYIIEDSSGVFNIDNTNGINILDTVTSVVYQNGNYKKYSTEIEIEVEVDGANATVVFECLEGEIFVYSIMGYNSPYTSKINYVTEGSFNYVCAEYETVYSWEMDEAYFGAEEIRIADRQNDMNSVMCIYPSCSPAQVPYNRVYCEPSCSGKAGEVLLLSGWAKATAINDDDCDFSLSLLLKNRDGTTTTKTLDYENNITDWQFASVAVPIEKDFSSVVVSIEYKNQVNPGYFDDIQLIKDNATSYVYDDEGNVVSVKTAVSDSQYEYDGNSRLVSAVDTTGRNFKYSYDDNHNLTSAVSDAATTVRYTYNSYGQAEFTETYANTAYDTPEDNGNYYIFLRGTGLYLTYYANDLVNDKLYYNSGSQKFTLQKQSDGYFAIKVADENPAEYISVSEGNDTYSISFEESADTDSTHFKFVRDVNGGYRIVPKLYDSVCIDNAERSVSNSTALTVSQINEENLCDYQVWYLENVEEKETAPQLKENTVYAIRNVYSGTYFAPLSNSTFSELQIKTGDYNGGKYILEKYGETEYYYIRILGTDLALSLNEAQNGVVATQYSAGNDSQLFKLTVYDEDPVARPLYSVMISPKLSSTKQLMDYGNSLSIGYMPMHWRSYWFFEELLYSSSSAVYNVDGTRLESTIDNATQLATEYTYDDFGRLTSTTVGLRTTQNTYDDKDRIKRVSSGGVSVNYLYNSKNQLTDIEVSGGYGMQRYTFSYDDFGNNTKIKTGSYTLAQYSYIGNTGLMSGMTYGNSDTIGYTYDNDYRLTSTVYTDKNNQGTTVGTKTINYEYDIFGNVYRLDDGFTGNTTVYNYDLLGRITKINKAGKISRNVTYDAFDRINGLTLSLMGKNINSSISYGDFGQVNSFSNTIGERIDTLSYTYDDFYRTTSRKLDLINKTSTYTYLKGNDGQDTVLVETLNNGKDTYKYTYDIYGNITSVAKNGTVVEEYEYDELNQLTYAKIGEDIYRYTYTCNDSSNLEFVYKNGKKIKTYGYLPLGETWVDKLYSFTGTDIEYDEIGNPLNWRNNMTLSWEYGRRLSGITKGTDSISYTYDAEGLRTSKTVNGTQTEYYWLDGVLQGQKTGSEYIIFLYDENGTAYGMLINQNGVETYYYYLFNLQGDIVGIMDSSGNTVTEYTYDAWGQLLSTTGNTELGNKNPLRYRGYYYDSETGFYYLKSRYYDPYVQRFINADGYVSTGQDITGYNMYAYCNNNPVNMVDQNGEASTIAQWWTSTMWWLCAVDTMLPIGDIIYAGVAAVLWGAAICGVSIAADTYIDSASTEKEEEKDIAPAIPKRPARDPIHHIVAQNDKRAKPAQDVLEEIEINRFTDPVNLVQLPAYYHRRLHTDAYYEYVNNVIVGAYLIDGEEGVYAALAVLKWEISSGAIF